MKNILSKTNRMRKALLKMISDIRCLLGMKEFVLDASEMNSEFLNNFDNIGDYKRVFPSQTRLNVEYPQTRPNLSKGMMDRIDIYAPPVNSFSVSSPCACFSPAKVLTQNAKMTNSFLNEFDTIHLSAKKNSGNQPDNFIYVKYSNGYIRNWDSSQKRHNKISLNECTLDKNDPVSSYFNMHKLNNGEGIKPGSVLMLDLYMS